MKTVDLACTGCGATADALVFSGHEHEYSNTTDLEFDVVRCQACGLVRLNPRPDVSELEAIYPPNYYAYGLVAAGERRRRFGVTGVVEALKRRKYQRQLAAIIARSAFADRPIRLLDVGCADGRLLDWYKTSPIGPRLETFGIDISAAAIDKARARGHTVVAGRFELDEQLPNDAFDLIFASHVIEHVDDPRAFAARARDLLAPGGLFIVGTPNFDSADVRFFRANWGGCHFPRHWTFYDAASIVALATSVGLVIDRVEYEVNPVFWNWTMHAWFKSRYPRSRLADGLFPTVEIFQPSLRSFFLLSGFTMMDILLRTVTGKTASMSVQMRRPA